ncbi:AAA family ATPase [Aquibacillus halophilus]|uniref:Nuclease SbcCD subunit C n=1 Tax=Aquibacillus halophilus TaxID=930132 RepID=A0A6A8DA99_9BACI|nr:SMC family ATPase [Aquibacillus halophilus]MRH42518.1 AAA family ATPase [Aquibacillus halophilus]
MKPLKLKLTAFGPYKNTETIDFTELNQNRLFVVSGNTGAGKTTIFDGICFALYGSASGEDRNDSKLLRSDFAEDDTHTSVELEFEIHGRIFRILRQLGHVKQGNKGATGERYEFYEFVNDKEVPCVDRQMVSEINKEVESLIGLSQDQFSQIVMLPQGEFRKLLTSQTENKEEILRRIFKTEPYKQITERLKEKKKVVEETFNQKSQQRDHYIKNIPSVLPEREHSTLSRVLSEDYYNINQVIEGLEGEVSFYEEKILLDDKKYNDAYESHDKKQTEYHQAKALNDQLKELDVKKQKLNDIQEKTPNFQVKEKQLKSAERASNVEVYHHQLLDWQHAQKGKNETLNNAISDLDTKIEKLENAQAFYQHQENKKNEREDTTKKLDRLQDILPIVKESDAKKQELSQLESSVKQLSDHFKSLEEQMKQKKKLKQELQQEINELEMATNQLPINQQQLTDMRENYKILDDYKKLNDNLLELEKELKIKKKNFESAQSNYTKIEAAWFNGQASILATHLHNGEPCPVCGSEQHPNKATNQDGTPTKEELEKAKNDLNKKDGDYRTVIARYETALTLVKEKQQEIEQISISLEKVDSVRIELLEEGKQLKNKIDQLKSSHEKLLGQREQSQKNEKAIEALEENIKQVTAKYNDVKSSYDTKRATYQERIQSIPEEIRILSELEKQIDTTKSLKLSLEKAWEEAQQKLQQAKEEHTNAKSNLVHAKKQVEETKEKTDASQISFDQALAKAGFASEQEYKEAILVETTRNKLKVEIDEFNTTLALLKEQVKELSESLKDKKGFDLKALTTELEHFRQAYETALNQLNQSKEYRKSALELKQNIHRANENVRLEEEELNRVTDLYDVIRGQNSAKISFERYLQIEYLEQIIQAANDRLRRLSNGQFYLMRSDRMESRGRQSGLGLDVHDAYTGQTRDVKTLSGGEKFNASLCLALGMADVIQSFQGGVSIETMFIDEGFGSLDEESLNKAIDTLIDLQQSGRMIGVISHVQELKTAIPAILQVEKTKEGFSRTRFVVN